MLPKVCADLKAALGVVEAGQSKHAAQRRCFHLLFQLQQLLGKLDRPTICASQKPCEENLMAVLNSKRLDLTDPIRRVIANAYASLYSNGDSRRMYDVVGELQTLASARGTLLGARM
jgi:hypothetical protein